MVSFLSKIKTKNIFSPFAKKLVIVFAFVVLVGGFLFTSQPTNAYQDTNNQQSDSIEKVAKNSSYDDLVIEKVAKDNDIPDSWDGPYKWFGISYYITETGEVVNIYREEAYVPHTSIKVTSDMLKNPESGAKKSENELITCTWNATKFGDYMKCFVEEIVELLITVIISIILFLLAFILKILSFVAEKIFELGGIFANVLLEINPASDDYIGPNKAANATHDTMVSIANIFILFAFVWTGVKKIISYGKQQVDLENFFIKIVATALTLNLAFYAVAAIISLSFEIGKFFETVMAGGDALGTFTNTISGANEWFGEGDSAVTAPEETVPIWVFDIDIEIPDKIWIMLLKAIGSLMVFGLGLKVMWNLIKLLLMRIIILFFLLITAPVAVVLYLSPVSMLNGLGDKWMNELLKQTAVYPILVVGLVIGSKLVKTIEDTDPGGNGFTAILLPAMIGLFTLMALDKFFKDVFANVASKMWDGAKEGITKTWGAAKKLPGAAGAVYGAGKSSTSGIRDSVGKLRNKDYKGALKSATVGTLSGISKAPMKAFSGYKIGSNLSERVGSGVKKWVDQGQQTDVNTSNIKAAATLRNAGLGNLADNIFGDVDPWVGLSGKKSVSDEDLELQLAETKNEARKKALNLKDTKGNMDGKLKQLEKTFLDDKGNFRDLSLKDLETPDYDNLMNVFQNADRQTKEAVIENDNWKKIFGNKKFQERMYDKDPESARKFYSSDGAASLLHEDAEYGDPENPIKIKETAVRNFVDDLKRDQPINSINLADDKFREAVEKEFNRRGEDPEILIGEKIGNYAVKNNFSDIKNDLNERLDTTLKNTNKNLQNAIKSTTGESLNNIVKNGLQGPTMSSIEKKIKEAIENGENAQLAGSKAFEKAIKNEFGKADQIQQFDDISSKGGYLGKKFVENITKKIGGKEKLSELDQQEKETLLNAYKQLSDSMEEGVSKDRILKQAYTKAEKATDKQKIANDKLDRIAKTLEGKNKQAPPEPNGYEQRASGIYVPKEMEKKEKNNNQTNSNNKAKSDAPSGYTETDSGIYTPKQ